jgi:hypothetical protein
MAAGASAILVGGWMGVESELGVIIIAVLYGFFFSGLIILPATAIAVSLCPDLRQYPVRMTTAWGFLSATLSLAQF